VFYNSYNLVCYLKDNLENPDVWIVLTTEEQNSHPRRTGGRFQLHNVTYFAVQQFEAN